MGKFEPQVKDRKSVVSVPGFEMRSQKDGIFIVNEVVQKGNFEL